MARSLPKSSSAIPASASCSFGRLYRRLQPGDRHHHDVDHHCPSAAVCHRPRSTASRPAGAGGLSNVPHHPDLLRYNREFALGAILILLRSDHVAGLVASRHTRRATICRAPSICHRPGHIPSAPIRAARMSSGSSLSHYAIRLLFGFTVALISRVIVAPGRTDRPATTAGSSTAC